VALFVLPLVMSVIQYAWTFFYLRLEDIDAPGAQIRAERPVESAAEQAIGGALPRLRLVERGRPEESEDA
jgi:hypothetical protein